MNETDDRLPDSTAYITGLLALYMSVKTEVYSND